MFVLVVLFPLVVDMHLTMVLSLTSKSESMYGSDPISVTLEDRYTIFYNPRWPSVVVVFKVKVFYKVT